MFDPFHRRLHYLRISVTDRCNLRCRYCMPPEGVPKLRHVDILTFEEIHALTEKAVELGFDKIRLTGGEPLTRRGIVELVRMISSIPGIRDFAMTTNATLLSDQAVALRQAGLHRLNISLDAVDPARYREITHGGSLDQAMAGIDAAVSAGFTGTKINCVVEKSPDEPDARAVAAFGRARGLEVRFIRRMDLQAGAFWPVTGGDGGHCARCNRLRVSSDGRIFPCLFSNLSYAVRELGAETALRLAAEHKPAAGVRSDTRISTLGG